MSCNGGIRGRVGVGCMSVIASSGVDGGSIGSGSGVGKVAVTGIGAGKLDGVCMPRRRHSSLRSWFWHHLYSSPSSCMTAMQATVANTAGTNGGNTRAEIRNGFGHDAEKASNGDGEW